jgi:molecular chaperone HtpG
MSKLTGDQKSDAQLIGQFGVGFYSGLLLPIKLQLSHAVLG